LGQAAAHHARAGEYGGKAVRLSVDEITRDREIVPESNESKKSGFTKSKI
jgi:hypothetical protein